MKTIYLGVLLILTVSCGSSDDDAETATSTESVLGENFPNFYQLAIEAAPSITSSSTTSLIGDEKAEASKLGLANFSTTYTTDATKFSDAFSLNQNLIGQVLNDAGISGPVKSIYVLLAQIQGTINGINSMTSHSSDESAAEGSSSTCTETSATTITTPFFDSATNSIFNSWVDSGKYTCIADDVSNGVLLFGREAIESPADGCETEDAYEFFVMEGYGQDDIENTEQVSTRGDSKDIASIKKFYYNGCTGDLKIAYVQTTLYSAGVEFSSRTELTGNATNHTFSLRSNFIDADVSYASHNTFVGHGVSKKTEGDTDDAYFIFGYRSDNCGTGADSSSCTLGTEESFCVKNAGTGVDFSLATDATNCATYETDYGNITALERSDLPSGYFEVSTSVLGL